MKENDKVGISFWARDGRQRAMLWLYRRCWSLLLVFLLILLPLYLFGRLADGVVEEDVFFFDRPILLLARSLANPTLDQVMVTLSRIGYAWGVIPFDIGLLILLCLRKRWSKAVIWALSVGGAGSPYCLVLRLRFMRCLSSCLFAVTHPSHQPKKQREVAERAVRFDQQSLLVK